MSTIALLSPLLRASRRGPVTAGARAQRVYLRQGGLEGACGQYCVSMALIALGVLERSALVRGGAGVASPSGRFWATAKPNYFDGTHGDDLAFMLDALTDDVGYERITFARPRAARSAIAERIAAGQFVLLAIEGLDGREAHWILAVGAEGSRQHRRFEPSAFLVLDPSGDAPLVALWNGRIELTSRNGSRSAFAWIGADRESSIVRLTDAIAVWRSRKLSALARQQARRRR